MKFKKDMNFIKNQECECCGSEVQAGDKLFECPRCGREQCIKCYSGIGTICSYCETEE